jgi:hypothetical protein
MLWKDPDRNALPLDGKTCPVSEGICSSFMASCSLAFVASYHWRSRLSRGGLMVVGTYWGESQSTQEIGKVSSSFLLLPRFQPSNKLGRAGQSHVFFRHACPHTTHWPASGQWVCFGGCNTSKTHPSKRVTVFTKSKLGFRSFFTV